MPIAFGEPFSFDQSLSAGPLPDEAHAEIQTRVLILGAGLAGLTCAYRYTQSLQRPFTRGDLLVLERESSSGGRVRSLKIGTNVLNLGAVTFQPTAYPRYMALLDELGLRERVRVIPRREMVFGIEGRALHANNLALAADGIRSLVRRGVFTPGEGVQLLRFYFYMRRVTSAAHFDELVALHDRSVAEWASQFGFSESMRRKFVESFIGFTFSTPENISAAFGVLLLGFNFNRPANLVGGMMQLPEAMAAKLKDVIETNALAMRVERAGNEFVTHYRQANKIYRVRSVRLVVAVPASVAAKLVPEMRERAQRMNYGSGSATLLRGKLKVHGKLHLWRVGSTEGTVLYGGEAQGTENGSDYLNLLTYRCDDIHRGEGRQRGGGIHRSHEIGEGKNAPSYVKRMFHGGQYDQLAAYTISPAVAAPQPKQRPLELDWGEGLYMAGDCTGIFPSQETAVSSGEQVARLIAHD